MLIVQWPLSPQMASRGSSKTLAVNRDIVQNTVSCFHKQYQANCQEAVLRKIVATRTTICIKPIALNPVIAGYAG